MKNSVLIFVPCQKTWESMLIIINIFFLLILLWIAKPNSATYYIIKIKQQIFIMVMHVLTPCPSLFAKNLKDISTYMINPNRNIYLSKLQLLSFFFTKNKCLLYIATFSLFMLISSLFIIHGKYRCEYNSDPTFIY